MTLLPPATQWCALVPLAVVPSAVAGALHGLGINIGDNLPKNFEDPAFSAANRQHFIEEIERRNCAYDVWEFRISNAVVSF